MNYKVAVMQLLGGANDYWIEAIWCGVTLTRAQHWLDHSGWGPIIVTEYLPWLGMESERCDYGRMRLRPIGCCWIENPQRPATKLRALLSQEDQ